MSADLAPISDPIVTAFLDSASEDTRRAYASDLRHLAAFLGATGIREAAARILRSSPGEANRLALAWQSAMTLRGLAPATANRRLAALRSLVKLARQLGAISWTLDVRALRVTPYRDTRGCNRAEYAAALADVPSARDLAVIRLLGDRALRSREIRSLDLEHVSGDALLVRAKGKREREPVTLAPATANALRAWLADRGDAPGPLFPGGDPEGRMTASALYRLARSLVGTHPHGLRHSAITHALDRTNGVVRAVQRFARHARPSTTLLYDDNRRDLGGEVAKLVAE